VSKPMLCCGCDVRKNRLDVGVDEGDRIIRVLVVRGQIMEHTSMLSNCAHLVAPSSRPPAHCKEQIKGIIIIKFGYVVVKHVWAASRVQSLVSLAAHRRQMDPHRRGRRPPSFLRNANKCKVYFCLRQYGVQQSGRGLPNGFRPPPSRRALNTYSTSLKPNQRQPLASTSPSISVTLS
jgi:hypothetical protein